ncbi:small subunit ribosomal protein S3Ae [Paratrimastix pyriformis]|uniref:Small ribosomal subunit protein eS1 n=1 Tax=Paratrimastix pyriformis TaxID=342808 RepID=A0ABQ9YMN6_9EUKA|nr:small subunit ribosomal protein S3Ae [Paratrimastix pyriformis]
MAIGKNKKLSKGSKKGGKKKIVDPFTRKEWFDVKVPAMFANRNLGKTCVNRTAGKKIASEIVKGRVIETSLAELNKNEEDSYRKFSFRIEDVQGTTCLTNFVGMTFTTDKLHSLVRKWQSLIESSVEVKTTDGFVVRLYAIAFTKKMRGQVRKTSYAQASQLREIRKKMAEIMKKAAQDVDLKGLVSKLTAESMGKDIEKACQTVYPLQNVFIRKAKLVKSPKLDVAKLMELYTETSAEDAGAKVAAAAAAPAPAAAPAAEQKKD